MSRIVLDAVLVLLVAAPIVVGCLGSNGETSELRREMQVRCHPIWQDLADGKIREGDDLDAFLVKYTPSEMSDGTTTEPGRATMRFIKEAPDHPEVVPPTISLIARDYRLTYAAAYFTDRRHVFFGGDSPDVRVEGMMIYFKRILREDGREWGTPPADNGMR